MDSFTCYSETVFYKPMTSFQDLHKKIAENQIVRTANQSPELYHINILTQLMYEVKSSSFFIKELQTALLLTFILDI